MGAIISFAIYGLVLCILFSAHKTGYDGTRAQGRDSLLFHSSLKTDNYPSTKEVFKTLEDAGIEPCFLKDNWGVDYMGIVIGNLVLPAIVGLLCIAVLLFVFYMGYLYIKEAKQYAENRIAESNFNKQQFVKNNRAVFGINDKECGDIKEIHTVSPQIVGF